MNPTAAEALRKWREEGTPTEQKNPYQKWLENDTRKTAIAAFCLMCMGTDDPDNPIPSYRSLIKECGSTKCPLYNWRPYKPGVKAEDEEPESILQIDPDYDPLA